MDSVLETLEMAQRNRISDATKCRKNELSPLRLDPLPKLNFFIAVGSTHDRTRLPRHLYRLITPFHADVGKFNAYTNLIERQIESGVHGLVPCGTTGETPLR